MITMIKEADYKDLKPYWDYQRKVAYNKEQVFQMVGNFEGRVFNSEGAVSLDEFRRNLWNKIPAEEYEDPPKDWVPEDENLRLENEVYKPGRKVILKAKRVQAVDK
tara:strand:- start:89 stop:406 length:318 start_codon:yes stop_codon:yes gene_type:complete